MCHAYAAASTVVLRGATIVSWRHVCFAVVLLCCGCDCQLNGSVATAIIVPARLSTIRLSVALPS
jgi:hypothetical protein